MAGTTAGSGSRLDKLIKLIDCGNDAATREGAAKQVAGIAKAHPQQLPAIVRRVAELLSSKSWETRVAASRCLGLLCEHFVHHSAADLAAAYAKQQPRTAAAPTALPAAPSMPPRAGGGAHQAALLPLALFDAQKVLRDGRTLTGAPEQGLSEWSWSASQEQCIQSQLQRMGLGPKVEVNGSITALNGHSVTPARAVQSANVAVKVDVAAAVEAEAAKKGLSARQLNQLKRKAKQLARKGSLGAAGEGPTQGPSGTGTPRAATGINPSGDGCKELPPEYNLTEDNDGTEWEDIFAGRWPFQRLHLRLCLDLFDPRWEIRHGAALGLRENLTYQAGGAGVWAPVLPHPTGWCCPNTPTQRALLALNSSDVSTAVSDNAVWLEDTVLRVLCLLALDRFADFVGDQVVAPVRETAAQVLGVASVPLSVDRVCHIMQQVVSLWHADNWQTRMSALTSAKYLVAANEEHAKKLAEQLLPTAMAGLEDLQEDVQSVAAQSLLPLVPVLHQGAPDVLQQLSDKLWGMLLDAEELSAATASVMELLSAIYQGPAAATLAGKRGSVSQDIPKLWPLMLHALSSVRLSAVRCLRAMLDISQDGRALGCELIVPTLYLLLQLLVIEHSSEVLSGVQHCWRVVLRHVGSVLQAVQLVGDVCDMWQLATVPDRQAIPNNVLRMYNATMTNGHATFVQPQQSKALSWANREMAYDVEPQGENAITSEGSMSVRLRVAGALGQLLAATQTAPVSDDDMKQSCGVLWDSLEKLLTGSHVSGTGVLVAALTLEAAVRATEGSISSSPPLRDALAKASALLLQPPQQLREAAVQRNALQRALDAVQLLQVPRANGLTDVQYAQNVSQQLRGSTDMSKQLQALAEALDAASAAVEAAEGRLRARCMAALACSLIRGQKYPAKISMLIQPLMAALGKESDDDMRGFLAAGLSQLVMDCRERKPCPNDKVVRNLCAMVCSDIKTASNGNYQGAPSVRDDCEGRSQHGVVSSALPRAAMGAQAALRELARQSGSQLISHLPALWELMVAPLWPSADSQGDRAPAGGHCSRDDPVAMQRCLRILQVVSPALHGDVRLSLRCILPSLAACARHVLPSVREEAASCAAALMAAHHDALLPPLLQELLPMLDEGEQVARTGGMIMLYAIVSELNLSLAPYCVLLIVPVLRRMTDSVENIRTAAAQAFARIVQLLPLAQGLGPPPALSDQQVAAWQQENIFLHQLLDNKSAAAFELPVRLSVQLRPYQEQGINWLAFLRRSGLHGILADDMGLGKTIQATAIIASSVLEQREALDHDGLGNTASRPLPTLIVGPPTLVSHWAHEITKYLPDGVLRVAEHHGSREREALQQKLRGHTVDVVVTSYETLRLEIEWLSSMRWDYCVLDEGHMIKNSKSKVSQACKRIQARCRLLLSGTPLQNNILELWSLFDFLMPGFLGTEKQFNATYGKTLQEARTDAGKRQSKAAQSGLLALEGLHKTVMPFILRRTKEQVLQDLPPKIMQDVFCDLSELQAVLYEDFTKTEDCQAAANALQGGNVSAVAESSGGTKPHVFTSLKYMRALCSHPLLVLDQQVPQHHAALAAVLFNQKPVDASSVHLDAAQWSNALQLVMAVQHSAKLVVLKELLAECGIGTAEGDGDAGPAHRVLIFAQLKAMLDIVEHALLQPAGISFVRLDGSVDARNRFQVVQQFNSDPTIDVMLLTTHVGGLGLNLTSADVVIFLEHDWNPTKDLQAMDRAHRLGQSRTVNVYRILTRGTIEERIMGLQKFKMDVASAVVNTDNMSMDNMDTSQLLDMFQGPSGVRPAPGEAQKSDGGRPLSMKAAVETLGELWAETQYDEQFDAAAFAKRLKKS